MSLEIEVKYLEVDHAALREGLKALQAQFIGRWFESNTVFDDAAGSLKAGGTLLRLRERSGRFILTLKRVADGAASTEVKVCHESETDVANCKAMLEILAGLGYRPSLRYEKIREKWSLAGCYVCLDTLPFGPFLELEGDEADIKACAEALKLDSGKASTATYHELNRLSQASKGLPPEDSFVFDPALKARLLARRATDRNEPSPLDMRPRSA